MKRMLLLILALCAASVFVITEDSEEDSAEIITGRCGDTVDYSWNLDTGTLTISGNGAMRDYYSECSPWSEEPSIKTIVIEEGVTSIGNHAFEYCTSVSKATIPNSVLSIGNYVFYNCTNLTSVAIGDSVTSIGHNTFEGCTSLLRVTIPDSVKTIERSMFKNCTSLSSVTIGNSVTSIEPYSFNGCTSLATVTIPNSVTSIESFTFQNCTALSSVIIGNSVTYIGPNSFDGCTSLVSVTIPSSVISIGNCAFQRCTSLTSVAIGEFVTSIGQYAFYRCTSLPQVIIPDSVKSVNMYSFTNCTSLKSIVFGNSITSIESNVIAGCTSLDSVTLGNSVNSINNATFSACPSLTTIIVSKDNENYTSIDGVLFSKDLKTLVQYPQGRPDSSYEIPDSVTTIGGFAFENCTALVSVNLGKSVTTFESPIIRCTSITSFEVSKDNKNYTTIDGVLFSKDLKTLVQYPAGKPDLSYELSDSVTTIDYYAFNGCLYLKTVNLGESVQMIDGYAFYACVSLTSATIPNSVTSIKPCAFMECTSLTSVIIGDLVTTIGYDTFDGCTALTSIDVSEDNVSYSSIEGVLFNKDQTTLIKYPAGKSGAYIVPNTVESIKESAFKDSINLTSVTMGDSVPTLNISTFENCISLSNIWIGKSVTMIWTSAFNDCTSLTSIEISEDNVSYSSIDGVLFNKDQTTLIKYPAGKSGAYIVPNTVESIKEYAFDDCTNLTSVIIPDSVTTIESFAFWNCTSLTSIVLGSSLSSIDTSAFRGTFYKTDGKTILEKTAKNLAGHSFKSVNEKFIMAYWVIFNIDGKEFSDIYLYNTPAAELILPENLSKASDDMYDYIFKGWDREISAVTEDVTYTAEFIKTPRNYKVSFETGGNYEVKFTEEPAPLTFDTISEIVKQAKSNSDVTLCIRLNIGTVTFDNAALKVLRQESAELSIDPLSKSSLSKAIKNTVGNNPTYNISFGSNTYFGNGKATVTLPYTLADGKDPDRLSVYYVKEDGSYDTIPCTYSDNTVTFDTNHFSVYAVVYSEPPGESENFPTIILVAVVIIVSIGAMGVVVVKMKRY